MTKQFLQGVLACALLYSCSTESETTQTTDKFTDPALQALKKRTVDVFETRLNEKFDEDPEFNKTFAKNEALFEDYNLELTQNELSAKQRLPLYTIKVVVNNIYRKSPISRDRINRQIRRLNEAFAGTIKGRPSGLPSNAERFNAGDTRIRFVLDDVKFRRNQKNFSDNSELYSRSSGGINPTNPRRRINIYVANLLDSRNYDGGIGDSSFPNDGDLNFDHIFVDQLAFGVRPGLGFLNEGKLLVHEMGHYLNLFHLPGRVSESCRFDDAVGDTPNTSRLYFGDVKSGRSTTSCGSQDMYWNFMNNTNDSEQFMFTNGQRNRMRFTLNPRNGPRRSLTNAR